MKDQVKKVKEHFGNHKELYIGIGIGATAVVAFAAGMLFAGESQIEGGIVQQVRQIGFRNESNQAVIQLVENSTPSKPLHLVGTNIYYDSIHDAARKTGHSVSSISRQINGHSPDVKGDKFEVLQLG